MEDTKSALRLAQGAFELLVRVYQGVFVFQLRFMKPTSAGVLGVPQAAQVLAIIVMRTVMFCPGVYVPLRSAGVARVCEKTFDVANWLPQ